MLRDGWGKGKGEGARDLKLFPLPLFPLPRFRNESELLGGFADLLIECLPELWRLPLQKEI